MNDFTLPERLSEGEVRRRLATPVPLDDPDELLTPAEVSHLFKCDPKTVTRWAQAGRLTSIRTLGGHRRYYASEVRALLAATRQERRS